VRELVNRVSNAVVVNQSGLLTKDEFPDLLLRDEIVSGVIEPSERGHYSLHVMFPEFPTMAQVERLMIHEALKRSNGGRVAAADLLGISRQTLKRKLDEMER
jgi:DNA-binding NtrC family response regulator